MFCTPDLNTSTMKREEVSMIIDSDDDDMIDAYSIESGEDDLDCDESGDEEEQDYGFPEDDIDVSALQSNYVVLEEDEIRKCQKEDIEQVSKVLSISEVEASVLLLRYHWNVSKVHDEWFADEKRVRSTLGIWKKPIVPSSFNEIKLPCGICLKSRLPEKLVSVSCGHRYCVKCWTMYISVAIEDGPGCLMLKCPEPSCPATFGQDMVDNLSRKKDKEKYDKYFLRSYIEGSKKMKWCPAPGCDHAIGFTAGDGRSSDVLCLCSHPFCWNCMEDAHRPVDCDTVGKWMVKNSAESENVNWLLANTKPCPMCKRPIEKNRGCMHMSCKAPCKHEFCWLCLGAWSEHGQRSGGYYACNTYSKGKLEGKFDEAERKRENAKNSLERYTHYFERWSSNEKSRKKAMEDLQKTESELLTKLSEVQWTSETHLEFILDAWTQIIECRRVLKWTYAYGYYLPESDGAKKRFFEYLQGEAESGLERLHKCVETELEPFLDAEGPSEDFPHFRTKLTGLTSVTKTYFENLEDAEGPSEDFPHLRTKLTGLTSVTKTYFENLEEALENGLADVDSHAAATNNSKGGRKGKGNSKKAITTNQ